jgi:DNA helicase HerA-like ATPase
MINGGGFAPTVGHSGRLGLVVEGSLTKGLTARLEGAYSVEDVRVGRFVKIEGEKFDFFCLVTDVVLGASSSGMLDDPPDPADDFLRQVLVGTGAYGSIAIQPMLMLNKQSAHEVSAKELGLGPQPVRTIPVHFARVNVAAEDDFARVFAPPGDQSWTIGTPLDMDIPVRLDLERLAERSNGIFGKSGSGKSRLTRLLLCGLVKTRTAVSLVFDMHSEYAWATRDKRTGTMLPSLRDLFGESVVVYTLQSSHQRPPGRKTNGDIRIGLNEIEVDDIALLSELLNLNETAVETIYLLQGRFADRWLVSLLDMTPGDIKEFCEEVNAHSGAVAALARKLNQLLQLEFVTREYVARGSSSIEHVVRSLADGTNVVLAFEHESQLLPYMLVTNVITRRIHERWTHETQAAHAASREGPRPLVITVEEAHKFLSPAAARHTSFGTISRELRKFNVTLLIVDQRPSGIDPEVLSQIGTRLTCQLNDENDIGAILAGVSGATHLRSVLASLDSQQQAMLLGHAVPMPVVLKVRTIDEEFYRDVQDRQDGFALPAGHRHRDLITLADD